MMERKWVAWGLAFGGYKQVHDKVNGIHVLSWR